MRVAVMIDAGLSGGNGCGKRTVTLSRGALSTTQREELEHHACSPEESVDYFIPDRDEEVMFGKVYRIGKADSHGVGVALDAWRQHRHHVGHIGSAVHEPAQKTTLH